MAGRRQLYDFCNSHGVAHRRCGKLIVATDEAQIAALEQLRRHALANGVDDLQYSMGARCWRWSPKYRRWQGCSPSTGIIDSHALMLALLGDAERHGAVLALNAPVTAITVGSAGLQVEVGGADPLQLLARTVVNCAGHGALHPRRAHRRLDPAARPRQFFAKGSYFSLSGRTPFRHLVYPLPEPGGLGVHLTDLAGQARFGPDVQSRRSTIASSRNGPRASMPRFAVIAGAAGRFVATGLHRHPPEDQRPRRGGRGLRIDGPAQHGVAGLVNLFGIESPGLTACLAIAEHVLAQLEPRHWRSDHGLSRSRCGPCGRAAHCNPPRSDGASPAKGTCMELTGEARPLKVYLAVGLLQGLRSGRPARSGRTLLAGGFCVRRCWPSR